MLTARKVTHNVQGRNFLASKQSSFKNVVCWEIFEGDKQLGNNFYKTKKEAIEAISNFEKTSLDRMLGR